MKRLIFILMIVFVTILFSSCKTTYIKELSEKENDNLEDLFKFPGKLFYLKEYYPEMIDDSILRFTMKDTNHLKELYYFIKEFNFNKNSLERVSSSLRLYEWNYSKIELQKLGPTKNYIMIEYSADKAFLFIVLFKNNQHYYLYDMNFV